MTLHDGCSRSNTVIGHQTRRKHKKASAPASRVMMAQRDRCKCPYPASSSSKPHLSSSPSSFPWQHTIDSCKSLQISNCQRDALIVHFLPAVFLKERKRIPHQTSFLYLKQQFVSWLVYGVLLYICKKQTWTCRCVFFKLLWGRRADKCNNISCICSKIHIGVRASYNKGG